MVSVWVGEWDGESVQVDADGDSVWVVRVCRWMKV